MGISKLFKLLGLESEAAIDNMTATIGAEKPELLAKMDRDALEANLSTIATELASASEKLRQDDARITAEQATIDQEMRAAENLAAQPGKDDALDLLTKKIETDQASLDHDKAMRAMDQKAVTELTNAKDEIVRALKAFDEKTKDAIADLRSAQAESASANATRRVEELISNTVKTTGLDTAIGAFAKKAAEARAHAEVDRTMVGLNHSEVEKNADIQNAMAAVSGGGGSLETGAERLARLRAARESATAK
jgi:hypothetical protein